MVVPNPSMPKVSQVLNVGSRSTGNGNVLPNQTFFTIGAARGGRQQWNNEFPNAQQSIASFIGIFHFSKRPWKAGGVAVEYRRLPRHPWHHD